MNVKKRVASALLLCAVGVTIAGLQCSLTVRQYTVKSDKIGEGKRLRIVMLSDLHSYSYGTDQSLLVNKVAEQQPDIILLCGDIVDDKKPVFGAQLLLQQITQIAPCYYVSGNHEYWGEDNESETITVAGEQYTICGVDDPAANGQRVRRSYGESKD